MSVVEHALLHTGGPFPARARVYPIQSNSSVARADQQAGQGAITLAYSLVINGLSKLHLLTRKTETEN